MKRVVKSAAWGSEGWKWRRGCRGQLEVQLMRCGWEGLSRTCQVIQIQRFQGTNEEGEGGGGEE